MVNQNITGIVLSGGKSSRMQTDKGFVSYKGKLLVEYALDLLKPLCSEILISANRNEYERFGYPIIKDLIYNIGPLGGIYSAIQKSSNDLNIFMACDVVGIDHVLLQKMVNASAGKKIVCLQKTDKHIEPFPVLLNKSIQPEIESQIETGDFKLRNLIQMFLNGNSSQTECIKIKNPLLNLNTLEDLKL